MCILSPRADVAKIFPAGVCRTHPLEILYLRLYNCQWDLDWHCPIVSKAHHCPTPCQYHQEFPRGLSSKNYAGPKLLSYNCSMKTGLSTIVITRLLRLSKQTNFNISD